MRHILFEASDSHAVVVLIKPAYFRAPDLLRHYVEPNLDAIPARDVVAIDLDYPDGRYLAKAATAYVNEQLLPAVESIGGRFLFVCDANYFKLLTKKTKADPHIGYVLPCAIKGYEHLQVIMGVNYGQLIYNPDQFPRLELALRTLRDSYVGNYQSLGQNIVHGAQYPLTVPDIAAALRGLHKHAALTCDIETFSLHPLKAGVGTIAFAWNQHHGVAFACDYAVLHEPQDGHYGVAKENRNVHHLLKRFFEEYQGKLIWHNAAFDIRSLIAALWMKDHKDYRGMLEGLEIMTRLFDDTKIIAYLATNSTAGNKLSLKDLAHEFAGNYAQDEITDITKIPLSELLEYNLVDCLATWYVHTKYHPKMVQDSQEALYHSLMLPSLKTIIQMELVGMPQDPCAVQHAKAELLARRDEALSVFRNSAQVRAAEEGLTKRAWEKDYQDRKSKAKNPEKIMPKLYSGFPRVELNPNSGPQLQYLLYEHLGLPVIDLTDTKQPATGGDTLKKLVKHTQDPEVLGILDALRKWTKVDKILTAFIPKFEEAIEKGDGLTWLHGNFNLGGTVSGRLSSSGPNLQQIPSKGDLGKLVKKTFTAPKGWLMCGADFNSLEDYISALTTKDPNKLKVYSGLKQYDITINGKTHRITEEDVVSYDGIELTGEELHEKLQNSQP